MKVNLNTHIDTNMTIKFNGKHIKRQFNKIITKLCKQNRSNCNFCHYQMNYLTSGTDELSYSVTQHCILLMVKKNEKASYGNKLQASLDTANSWFIRSTKKNKKKWRKMSTVFNISYDQDHIVTLVLRGWFHKVATTSHNELVCSSQQFRNLLI